MKQITLNVAENKLDFFIDLIRNFDFVKVEKQAEPSNAEILRSIETGMKQVELIRKGKLPKKKIEDLLREL
ncbi:MAG: hypothetical protein AB7P01_02145 [Bacteroidia bacterium]